MSSRRQLETPFLGESWATWQPEEEDEVTNIETDEDIGSPAFDSSFESARVRTSSHDGESSQSQRGIPQDASLASLSGPELIMPSIHEDFSGDSSWVVPHPENQGGVSPMSRKLRFSVANPPGHEQLA